MEREKEKLVTPGGINVEVLKWITGREKRDITNVLTEGVEFDSSGQAKGLKADLLNKQDDELIKRCVVSVNGQSDNLLDRVLDLPSVDYDFIIEKLRGKLDLSSEKKTK